MTHRRFFRAAAVLLMVSAPLFARDMPLGGTPVQRLREIADKEDVFVDIVGVRLPVPFTPEGRLSAEEVRVQRAAIAQAKAQLLRRHVRAKAVTDRTLSRIPYVVVSIGARELDDLIEDENVTSIEENISFTLMLSASGPLVGASQAYSAGWSGSGKAIAVLDSGFDTLHRSLRGALSEKPVSPRRTRRTDARAPARTGARRCSEPARPT